MKRNWSGVFNVVWNGAIAEWKTTLSGTKNGTKMKRKWGFLDLFNKKCGNLHNILIYKTTIKPVIIGFIVFLKQILN